ncbi:superoxide dismutase, Cu-Zn family [Formosa sp. Hel1_31_208]|uniref:superoxide dismutase family protein n=1 Tax=Formosa sp. Hel1_31_208 TaxID=1798225 RepID=UPI00087D736C|nr:superoxide dismutase family protein [Formosa sp. Hel1_31_208]SDS67234.1 superoxide dismutase, Cu-Zn family [Formosa sp. Hel1_31_208]
MKRSIFYITILALCLSISCKSDKKDEATEAVTEVEAEVEETPTTTEKTTKERPDYFDEKKMVTVTLDPKSNSGVSGNVIFSQEAGVVTMMARLSGLTPGEHAIHIHETADCSSDDGKSSGGHWNPTGQPHGKWGDVAGYHKGDIGNFTANAEGKAQITKVTDEWCIGCGDATKDILGKAIIVHQGVDDFKSQPSGAAGTRVSCGGIIE